MVFFKDVSLLEFVWFFFSDLTAVMGFGREDHRGKVHFQHILLRSCTINTCVTIDVDFNCVAEVVSVRFFHCIVTLVFFFCIILFEITRTADTEVIGVNAPLRSGQSI